MRGSTAAPAAQPERIEDTSQQDKHASSDQDAPCGLVGRCRKSLLLCMLIRYHRGFYGPDTERINHRAVAKTCGRALGR